MTPEDREAAFQRLLANTVNYFEKVEAEGDLPWFKDPEKLDRLGIKATDPIEARRELFYRQYKQPAPPKGLSTNLADIRGGL
ncbi:hypothetical protein [Mycolicibacterium llatzerense]|uniref:hypothetical protein n=1 Tax=Mycolicibacterium llatzerense TaxID=280871 RepID=UPI0008DC9D98|nr:hypothetical protein [Mycolicibacterium llatzerense]